MTKRIANNVIEHNELKVIDLFAGIGGIRLGFEEVFKNKLKFVFSSEIDSNAQKTYNINFYEKPFGDITKIDEKEIPEHDIILAGFPCQAFSVAGHRKGFDDTRGTLFFDVARIAKHHKPKVIFLENVKGFVGHDNGNTFKVVKQTLKDIGYKVFSKVLNSKDFGIPQNRERIYIIAFLDNSLDFKFPLETKLEKSIKNCLETNVEKKYYYNGKPLFEKIKDDVVSEDSVYQWRRRYIRENKSLVCPTLTANMGTGGHNVPIIKDKVGIRKLTPRECGNFQGFPASYKIPTSLADSHLYKQFGNSVSINVIKSLAVEIKKSLGY
ncbi:DNA cytosine methyltransferase [Sulfurospirillum arcachonense]|uniref:DNA cytosine methyltransferase n=1 Tax=Sulfurospirillum arcachonense TaxID=57666 RepID=UPI0004684FEF|nr:DNA cytosine methyltransferase [Sulfurospirillum arcachonense]